MYKILMSLLILLAASDSLFGQDTITIYYDNNWIETLNKNEAVFYRKAFTDSNNVWKVQDYYINNMIQMTGAYKSKKLVSKQGHFVYYYENGNKTSEGNYVDDQEEGLWNYWLESGQKRSEGKYLKGEKTGVWNYWYTNGQLASKETYTKGGSFFVEGYHENGNIRVKGNCDKGIPEGMWVYWNSDGRITMKGNFNHGLRDGEWIRSFRDGEMKITYNNGFIEGKQLGGIARDE
jgi:uncharacterized protein